MSRHDDRDRQVSTSIRRAVCPNHSRTIYHEKDVQNISNNVYIYNNFIRPICGSLKVTDFSTRIFNTCADG